MATPESTRNSQLRPEILEISPIFPVMSTIPQAITSKDTQPSGELEAGVAVVRSIFAVYNDDEQEGGLMLLNLMERMRIALLKQVVIGNQFTLDLDAGLETMAYPDDTAPYFVGEMLSTWKLPAVEREVSYD